MVYTEASVLRISAVKAFHVKAVNSFIKDKWPEFVVMGLLVVGGFWALSLLWDLNAGQARVEAQMAGLDSRMNRFSDALPELRKRVAGEAVFGDFKTAVLVTKPFQGESQGWASRVLWVDARDQKFRVYSVPLAAEDNSKLLRTISGSVHMADEDAISIAKMAALASEVGGLHYNLAGFVEPYGSYIMFKDYDAGTLAGMIDGITAMTDAEAINWDDNGQGKVRSWNDLNRAIEVGVFGNGSPTKPSPF